MDKILLMELGINKLQYNLYGVASRNLSERINIELSNRHIHYNNLTMNHSKNRIVLQMNILENEVELDSIKEIAYSIISKTIIPVKNLSLSNALKDYVIWIQGMLDEDYFYFREYILTDEDNKKFLFMKIDNINSYKNALEKIDIILENESRRKFFLTEANKLAKETGVSLYKAPYIIENYINKYNLPYPLLKSIDNKYLKYPSELLIAILLDVCGVIPLINEKNILTPYFILCVERKYKHDNDVIESTYTNIIEKIDNTIAMYEKAMSSNYEYYLEKMKTTDVENGIGTLYDETIRLKEFTKIIGNYLNVGEDTLKNLDVESEICKLDLVTKLVKSTPEMKGIMGYLYAKHNNYNNIVSSAMYMYHRPRFHYDNLPETTSSKILSIADKLDSITNSFIYNITNGIDNTFQTVEIRRKTSGIINIITNNKWKLNIENLVNDLVYIYIKYNDLVIDFDLLKSNVVRFIVNRYKEELINKGLSQKEIDCYIRENIYNNIGIEN